MYGSTILLLEIKVVRHLFALKRDFITLIWDFIALKIDLTMHEVRLQSDEVPGQSKKLRTSPKGGCCKVLDLRKIYFFADLKQTDANINN